MSAEGFMRTFVTRIRDERGSTATLVAVSAVALLSIMALGIDLGMLFTARSEAQRAADAAALAGASAFKKYRPLEAVPHAKDQAIEYALLNTLRNVPIDSSEVTVTVIPDSTKVRVFVGRNIATWFARIFGVDSVRVGARAAAVASNVGAAKCLKPFALPDVWHDAGDDTNGNRLWDGTEAWTFGDDPGDYYKKFTGPGGDADETGYGGAWRNPPYTADEFDYGRRIKIKVTDPSDIQAVNPSIFLPWSIPVDGSMEPCGDTTEDPDGGAALYRKNICSCNTTSITLGAEYPVQTGNMVGPTFKGVQELVSEDPGAYWDEFESRVKGSIAGDLWLESPRVVRVALWDPTQIVGPGMSTIVFNNFALFFIEAQATMKEPVTGRFLYYVTGSDAPGADQGSLVKALQLVE